MLLDRWCVYRLRLRYLELANLASWSFRLFEWLWKLHTNNTRQMQHMQHWLPTECGPVWRWVDRLLGPLLLITVLSSNIEQCAMSESYCSCLRRWLCNWSAIWHHVNWGIERENTNSSCMPFLTLLNANVITCSMWRQLQQLYHQWRWEMWLQSVPLQICARCDNQNMRRWVSVPSSRNN